MPRRLLRTYHLQLTDDEFRLLKELKLSNVFPVFAMIIIDCLNIEAH